MNSFRLFRQIGIAPADYDDLHVSRMLHAFVAVSGGEVILVDRPLLRHCPLVSLLYDREGGDPNPERLREMIREMTAEKIARFGHFTTRREIRRGDVAVPYGASEMMMFALRKGVLDGALTVCDGCGSVIARDPELVQGIGARMNGLFYTTPIPRTIRRLEGLGCSVPFPADARIDQIAAARHAAGLGLRRFAVTVNGYLGGPLAALRDLEGETGTEITIIIVCTTGSSTERVGEMCDHADLVWSCASEGVRTVVGGRSIIQVSSAIPVFAVTDRGVRFLAAYSDSPELFAGLDRSKQYLIAGNASGRELRMGDTMRTTIAERELPVRSEREPRPLS
jgi:putative methanogenesis marker protein 8